MSLGDLYAREVVTMALATSRFAGVVVTSPFPGEHVPARIKVALVCLFGWLVTTTSAPADVAFDLGLIGPAATELAIGLVMGISVRFTFACAEILGANIAQSLGLSMAHVFDPTLGSEDSVVSRFVTLLGMLLFFGLGAHRVFLGYVFESFHALPIGRGASFAAALPLLVDQAAAALASGVHLALPVTVVGLAIQMTLAFVSRASPQLQIFNVGVAVSLGGGLLVMMASLDDIAAGIAGELGAIGPRIESLLGAIAR